MVKNKHTYSSIIDNFFLRVKKIKKVKYLNSEGKYESLYYDTGIIGDTPNSFLNYLYNNKICFNDITQHLLKVCSEKGEINIDVDKHDSTFLDAFEKNADEVLGYLYDKIINNLSKNAVIMKESELLGSLIYSDLGYTTIKAKKEEDYKGIDFFAIKGDETLKIQIKSSYLTKKEGTDKLILTGFLDLNKWSNVDILIIFDRTTNSGKNNYNHGYIITTKDIINVFFENGHWTINVPMSSIKIVTENELKNLKKKDDYNKGFDSNMNITPLF